jgi:hypothetical protein
MLIKEIVQRVLSVENNGVHRVDDAHSMRWIYSIAKTVRGRILTQESNKKKKLSIWNYQTLPCVQFERVKNHQCECVDYGCYVLRSVYPIPRPLEGIYGGFIKSVTSIDKAVTIDPVDILAATHLSGNKYTAKKTYYYIQDGYMYIVNNTTLETLSIIGLFEDPIEAMEFPSACDTEAVCLDYPSVEFPLDNSLVDYLIQLILTELHILASAPKQETQQTTE